MPSFKKGRQLMKERAQGGGKSGSRKVNAEYVPFFRLQDGEAAYVQILTDMDDVPLVELHRMVAVKYKDKEGKIKEGWADFTSRAPGLFEDGDGTDWKDILENQIGHDPDEKFAGVGVKLTPNFKEGASSTRIGDIESFTVQGNWFESEKSGMIFFPAYEVIFQASGNFWRKLDNHHEEIGPITQTPWKVIREGGDNTTDYMFYNVGAPVYLPEEGKEDGKGDKVEDWSEVNVPSIEDILATLGSHERYVKYFGDSDLWAKQKPWAKKNAGGNNDESEAKSSGSSTKKFSRLEKLAETY